MKIFFILFFLCIIGVLTVKKVNTRDEVNMLLLSNIEALASGEGTPANVCIGIGSIICPRTVLKVEWVTGGYSLEVQ